MKKLDLFSNTKLKITIRTVVISKKPYFIAIDIAKALGYKTPKDAVRQHCKRAIKHRLSDNQGVPHDYKVIPEGDVYRLIMRSKLPGAMDFQDWVVNEVLPSIRENGMFVKEDLLDNPEFLLDTVKKLVEIRREKELTERQLLLSNKVIEKQAPKVEYHDEVLSSQSAFNITTIAKELGMSGQALNKILYKQGIIWYTGQHWVLYATYQSLGYTKTRTATFRDTEGREKTVIDTLWTEKGRKFIHSLLNEKLVV